jgi:hypothetical protein
MVVLISPLVAGCWLGASQHSGPGDDGAGDDDDDGAASDGDADADSDPWSGYQPGELLGATSVKASGFYDTLWDMAAMPGGGVVVLGEFGGTAKFDPEGPNETALSSDKGRLFMARYDEDLGLLWARHVFVSESPGEHDQARSVAVHPDGGFVVAGRFAAGATFGAGQGNEVHFDGVADPADRRLYVARFDGEGALLWVRVAAQGSRVNEPRVAAAPDGRVLAVTTFGGTLDFEGDDAVPALIGPGNCLPQSALAGAAGYGGLAVAAFSDSGEALWLRGEGLPGCTLRGEGVFAGADGGVSVAVLADGATPFQVDGAQVELGPVLVLLRYGGDGALSAATPLVGVNDDSDFPNAVSSRAGVAGLAGPAWGASELHLADDQVFSLPSETEGYVLALDGELDVRWLGILKSTFSSSSEPGPTCRAHDVAVTSAGEVLVAAGFRRDFAAAAIGSDDEIALWAFWSFDLPATMPVVMAVARFSGQGVPDWAVMAGGGASCFARAVAESESGAIFAGGSFGKNAVFGAGEPGETELATSGGWDVFLARYVP